MESSFKPCPFCGGAVEIIVCDRLGNFETEDYENNPSPRRGLRFCLSHSMVDNPECPIANDPDEPCGTFLYDTRKDAINAWNKRA